MIDTTNVIWMDGLFFILITKISIINISTPGTFFKS